MHPAPTLSTAATTGSPATSASRLKISVCAAAWRSHPDQRNLRHLFTWLEAEYDHPHPYTDDLSRYAPAAGRPSTLSADFIRDLLTVTGGGHSKASPDVRDHALIRVLTEGLRRTEVTEMRMTDLPLDLVSQRLTRVAPLKGARAEEDPGPNAGDHEGIADGGHEDHLVAAAEGDRI